MRRRSNFFALMFPILVSALLAKTFTALAQDQEGPYTFTIYVEEANPNGHVFIGICNGLEQEKWGWYTQGETTRQKLPGVVGCAGGLLRSDNATPFNVSKTYPISRHDYYVLKSQVL